MISPHRKSSFANACISPPKNSYSDGINSPLDDSRPEKLVGVGKALPLTSRREAQSVRKPVSSPVGKTKRYFDSPYTVRAGLIKVQSDNQRTLSSAERLLKSHQNTSVAASRLLSKSLDEDMLRKTGAVTEDTSSRTAKSSTVVFNRTQPSDQATKHVWINDSGSGTEIVDVFTPNKHHRFEETSDSCEIENGDNLTPLSISMESLNKNISDSNSEDEVSDSQESAVSSLTIESYASAQDRSSAMEIISSMWDDFSVDSYLPNEGKVVDVTKKHTPKWYPRVTVPRPFSMTIREQNSVKKRSRSAMEAEREKLEKEVLEEFELKKKFKAIPVPSSTYLPLYQLIVAENEQRRAQIKQSRKEMLKASERPFSFMKRDEERMKQKSAKNQDTAGEKAIKLFVAKPVPKYLFADNTEKVREMEEYREIKKKVRARELLQSSKLPKSMQVRGRDYTIGALRKRQIEERQKKAFLTEEHKFHPRITAEVPDHVQSHIDNEIQLARNKQFNVNTTVEPFNLKTQLIPSRIEKVYEDIARDEERLPETRWPYKSPRLPVKQSHLRSFSGPSQYSGMTTEASRLWEAANKRKFESSIQKELKEEQSLQEKRQKEKEIQRRVSDKVKSNDRSSEIRKGQQQKHAAYRLVHLSQYFGCIFVDRALQKAKEIEYQLQLEEMTERLNTRPLLLERTSLDSARKMAEAKYIAALKKAGLTDEEILELENL